MTSTKNFEFAKIDEYLIEEEIGRGATSIVYRGVRETQSFAVKVTSPVNKEDGAQVALRFRKEVAAAARLNDPGLVKVLEVGEVQNRPYVVMDLAVGRSLDRIVRDGGLSESQTVAIIIAVAHALVEVHRFGLVHRDIKPENIVVSDKGETKLIDFGFVTGVERDESESDAVVGTLLYASPEQMGVLKRPVDGRSDLYSLGATMYECLTGKTPLQASSLQDLVVKLMAKEVPDIRTHRTEASPVLAAIVKKLLAKDPDDRYQSARGLLADLERLPKLEEAYHAGRPLPLGEQEVLSTQELPMVGRDQEMHALRNAWGLARGGTGLFAQAAGESGSGKTRLVRELLAMARSQGALVLMGKCQELETTPFGPLREALEDYASSVKHMPSEEREATLARIRKAAGDKGALIKRLAHGMGPLLGDVQEPPALEADLERIRFYEAIVEFIGSMAKQAGAAILVVDDIQWLDTNSLEVLEKITKQVGTLPLLVLSTARSDEKSAAARDMYQARIGDALKTTINLQGLDKASITQLVTATLGGKPLEAHVVDRLATLTRGNPFAIGEYLRALLDHGYLRPYAGGWTVAPEALSEVTLPRDILQLVVNRLSLLGEETARVVGFSALFGRDVAPALLADACGLSVLQTSKNLEESVRANLLEHREGGLYTFVHDRVREAAVERWSAAELQDMHQAIAKVLDKEESQSEAQVYALAHHYGRGHAKDNAKRVAETNLAAGLLAVSTSAFGRAYELLFRAEEYSRLAGTYDNCTLELEEGLGRACAMTGRPKEANIHLEAAFRVAPDDSVRFRLQYLITLVNAVQSKVALDPLWRAFEYSGRPFPKSTFMQIVTMLMHLVGAIFLKATGWKRGSAHGEQRAARKTLSQLNALGGMLSLYNCEPVLMMQFVIRDVYNVHFLGVTEEAAVAYGLYGATLCLLGLRKTGARYVQLAEQVSEQLGNPGTRGIVMQYKAFSHAWSGDSARARTLFIEALTQLSRHLPGSENFAVSAAGTECDALFLGHSRTVIERSAWLDLHLAQTNHPLFVFASHMCLWAAYMLCGRVTEAAEVRKPLDDLYNSVSEPPKYMKLAPTMTRLQVAIDQEAPDSEIEDIIQFFYDLKIPVDYYANCVYKDIAYFRLSQYVRARDPEARRKSRKRFKSALLGFRIRAELLPLYRCHAFAMRAALARIDGKFELARKLLLRGAADAQYAQTSWGRYAVALEQARVAAAEGNMDDSRAHAMVAYDIGLSEGWKNRTVRVVNEFKLTVGNYGDSSSIGGGTATMSRTSRFDVERYGDALLQVSLASAASLEVNDIAGSALSALSRVLGAERALLFLADPSGKLELKASYGVDEQATGEVASYSSTAVQKVAETRAPVIIAGTEEGEALGSKSAVVFGLRSIMAAPLMLRDKFLGVVYLDNRLAKGVFTQDDVKVLFGIGNHIAIAVETSQMAELKATNLAYKKDQVLTAAVQSMLLPRSATYANGDVSLAGFYRPADECGGDWWWYGLTPEGRVRVLIGDVMGHGGAPAMLTASVAGGFRMLCRRETKAELPEMLEHLHDEIGALTDREYTMTMSAIEFDPKTRELNVWSAAAPPVVVLDEAGKATLMNAPGVPLGSKDKLALGHVTKTLGPKERMILYTDGLPELSLPDGNDLGMRRLMKIFTDNRTVGTQQACSGIVQRLDDVRQMARQNDDLTFVVVDV